MDAHGRTTLRVVADSAQRHAERGLENQILNHHAGGQNAEREEIPAADRTDGFGHWHAVDAVVPAGQSVPAERDGPQQGSQRDLQHAEIEF